jgi:hypothetical protein
VSAADDDAPDQGPWSGGALLPPYRQQEPRPWRPTLRAGVIALAALLVLGAPLGLLWRLLAPEGRVVQTARGPYPVDPQPEQYVATDGWFALLGLGFGVLAAVLAWRLLRRHRGPVQLAAVVLGAAGAAPLAWLVGRLWQHGDFEQWRRTAPLGAITAQPPDLRAYGVLLVPAFAAVITYTLLAGWAHDPELAPPDDEPVSSGWPGDPAPTTAPAPPVPGATAPPHG